jgi:hypothetical protein
VDACRRALVVAVVMLSIVGHAVVLSRAVAVGCTRAMGCCARSCAHRPVPARPHGCCDVRAPLDRAALLAPRSHPHSVPGFVSGVQPTSGTRRGLHAPGAGFVRLVENGPPLFLAVRSLRL